MTTPFVWNTLITIIEPTRKKCPALRITGADSQKGQFVTFTFCLYEEPKLQTILHLPYRQINAWNTLLRSGIILVESCPSPLTQDSLEKKADELAVPYLPRETEILDHQFKRTKPVANDKFYPFQKLLEEKK